MGKGNFKEILEDKKLRLELYKTAEKKILTGQSYSIGSRQLTRADLATVQKQIRELETDVQALEKRGTAKRRSARLVPVD